MSRPKTVVLPPQVRRAILAEARRERPRECCGFLVGRNRTVLFAVAMPNVDRSATRYRIDDRAHIDLRRALRRFGPALHITGVYHSHPAGPAEPSPTDLAQAFYPDWIHLIVGLGGRTPVMRAYRLAMGAVERLALARADGRKPRSAEA